MNNRNTSLLRHSTGSEGYSTPEPVGPRSRTYIGFIRVPADAVDVAAQQQRQQLDAWAEHHGLIKIGEIVVYGNWKAASLQLRNLIARKAAKNDFEVLVAVDWTRITRDSLHHAGYWRSAFEAAGVDLKTLSDGASVGHRQSFEDTFRHAAAVMYSRDIVRRCIISRHAALLQRRIAHASVAPFGVDRLHLDGNGNPCMIVRNCRGGSKVVLDGTGEKVLWELPRPTPFSATGLQKQRGHHVTLVPGSADRVKLIRQLFLAAYIEEWNVPQVVAKLKLLGDSGERTWTSAFVRSVLSSSVYLGVAVASWHTPLQRQWRVIPYPRIGDAFVPKEQRLHVWDWQYRQWKGRCADADPHGEIDQQVRRLLS